MWALSGELETKKLILVFFPPLYLYHLGMAQMVKNLPAMQETQVWSLGQEDPPVEGNSNPLQYSCLENPMDRGAWQATAHGVTKSWTGLSDQHFHFKWWFEKKKKTQNLIVVITFFSFIIKVLNHSSLKCISIQGMKYDVF